MAATLLSINSLIAHAQQKWQEVESFRKAVRLVTQSMDAYGGTANTDSIETLFIDYGSQKYMDGQSFNFLKPNVPLPVSNSILIDFKNNRLVNETADRYLGGYLFHFRTVYLQNSAFSFEVPNLRFSAMADPPLANKEPLKQNLLRHLPNYILRSAIDKKFSLRYKGARMVDGRKREIISFPYSPALTLDLYLDAETNLLYKYVFFTDHLIHGTQQITYTFPAYQIVCGVVFPTYKIVRINGKKTRIDTLKTIEVNPTDKDYLFQKPLLQSTPVRLPTAVKEIGKNIFMIEGLRAYNPLFLNFKDSIVMIEAVNGSDEAVRIIQQRFPKKRIQKIILSYYHDDHTAGLPYFIKNKIPILTTPSNRTYIQYFNNALHSVLSQEMKPNAAIIETLKSRKILSDENLTMELIPVGRNSHAEELIAFYFPQEKILYQADMLISKDKGGLVRPLIPVNIELYEMIKREKLDVKIIYGVHWKEINFEDLEQAVKEHKSHYKLRSVKTSVKSH